MKIYSELTKKEYPTVEECLKDEKDFKIKQEEEKKKKDLLVEERKKDAKEIEDAYKAIIEANKTYQELRDNFVKKYGSFHMTVKNRGSEIPFDLFDWLLDW